MSLIKIEQLEGYIQTIYMAVYPDKILLLDGACRADVSMILSYINDSLNRLITDLKAVVVTHAHPDHAGGARYLKMATGCQIISVTKDRQWYSGVGGRTMHLIDLSMAYYVSKRLHKPLKNLWYPAEVKPDVSVTDGDCLPEFEDWQVIETPGHTDRDISLYHPQTRQVYTADLIIKLRHKFVSPVPIYLPKIYRNSLKKIKSLEPKRVLLAHGGAMYIEPKTFDYLIEHAPKTPLTVKNTIKHKLFW